MAAPHRACQRAAGGATWRRRARSAPRARPCTRAVRRARTRAWRGHGARPDCPGTSPRPLSARRGARTHGRRRPGRLGRNAPSPRGARETVADLDVPAFRHRQKQTHAVEGSVVPARDDPPSAPALIALDALPHPLHGLASGPHAGRAPHIAHHVLVAVERDQDRFVLGAEATRGKRAVSIIGGSFSRAPIAAGATVALTVLPAAAIVAARSPAAPRTDAQIEEATHMVRTFTLAIALLLALTLASVRPAAAQTKDDTIVYALQSDVDTWDPPNSVLRRPSSSATTSSTIWVRAI